MSKHRVGVVRGGPSSEYEVSLKTGGSVLAGLPEYYKAHDILIARDGTWHLGGIPMSPERVASQVDVIFNALHGEYGEDGKLQSLLEHIGVPYTGSNVFASAIGMNKPLAKEVFKRNGIKVPYGFVVKQNEVENAARYVFEKMSPPWVVKPADRGSSVGLALARNFKELEAALEVAFSVSPNVLVEEYINGREATCGVVDNFRNKEVYSLPPIEIRKPKNNVWNYHDKYTSGATEEICPGNFNNDEKMAIEKLAAHAHQALGLRHYSRSDFIISPKGIYLLEVNTLPGMTETSLLPKALQAVGCSYPDFLDHIIKLALQKR